MLGTAVSVNRLKFYGKKLKDKVKISCRHGRENAN